ncbi:sulfite exporter TauE/SafE family protein [Cetobacterium sp. 8H]|uniref:sulfite exporter TauE/SafE family protein n=1 Tax=Cetobacterium sp. 8H TaxID=2759681 RepID=UPI00163BE0CE|nr:sulfite exporter TauE/SafE family protein [Cetobacterium sp. 8H]MBC2850611.1 sulfite exporter TauE/SafE family protein [Cetobacterium sp. 8H]
MFFTYFLIATFATILGSLAGLGGGVIIKPILDTLGHYDLSTVGVLSSITVFSMALVSTFKQIKSGFKIEINMVLLSLGSILGGGIGETIFDFFLTLFVDQSTAKGIQALIIALLLLVVLFKNKLPKYHIQNNLIIFMVGIVLGAIAAFLGIGGGPINVAVLIMFFSFSTKNAAISSIFIILLSQLSKILLIMLTTGFSSYNLNMLPFMVIGGISGGFIGASLNKKLKNKQIEKIFNISVISIILLNIYNVYISF